MSYIRSILWSHSIANKCNEKHKHQNCDRYLTACKKQPIAPSGRSTNLRAAVLAPHGTLGSAPGPKAPEACLGGKVGSLSWICPFYFSIFRIFPFFLFMEITSVGVLLNCTVPGGLRRGPHRPRKTIFCRIKFRHRVFNGLFMVFASLLDDFFNDFLRFFAFLNPRYQQIKTQ